MPASRRGHQENMSCTHTPIALLIIITAFLLFWNHSDGFRSQEEKTRLAEKIITPPLEKPDFNSMKSLGLDGAEFYEVRQLWNNQKFTKKNITNVL